MYRILKYYLSSAILGGLLLTACKPDTKASSGTAEHRSTPAAAAPAEPRQSREIPKGEVVIEDGVQKVTMTRVETTPGEPIPLPKATQLLRPSDLAEIFNVPSASVGIDSRLHRGGSRVSRTVMSWRDDSDEPFQRVTFNLNTNPLPGELTDWAEQSLGGHLEKGIRYDDGSVLRFKEINKDGVRYIWNKERSILRWFRDEDYSMNVTKFGTPATSDQMIQVAHKINSRLDRLYR